MKAGVHITIVLLLLNLIGFGQQNPCTSILKDANDQYEDGWFDESVKLANEALENCDLTRMDKVQVYKLLILNYLAIDRLEEANEAAASLMRVDPNYEPDKLRDPVELILLFERYRPAPIFRGWISTGINTSTPVASATYSVLFDDNAPGLDNYERATGFQLGVGFEYRLFDELWVGLGLQYRNTRYGIQLPASDGSVINYQESLNLLDVPLQFTYYFLDGDLKPFVLAGVNFSFLGGALAEISREDESDIIDQTTNRNTFLPGYNAGAGLSYAFKSYSIRASLGYTLSPRLLNREDTRFNNLGIAFKYYYVDNDFSVNYLQFNLGFTYTLAYKNVLTDTRP